MEFKDGASVYAASDQKAGSLQRVVIDPETMEVTHIVIRKGLLAQSDKVIAFQEVSHSTPDAVILTCSGDALDELPPLEIEETIPISGTGGAGQTFNTLEGGISPTPNPQYNLITTTKRTIPEDLIALKLGASVISDDGQSVGKVGSVLTGHRPGKITDLIVIQGLLKQSNKSIPVQWVKLINEHSITLSVDSQQIEELPEGAFIR